MRLDMFMASSWICPTALIMVGSAVFGTSAKFYFRDDLEVRVTLF